MISTLRIRTWKEISWNPSWNKNPHLESSHHLFGTQSAQSCSLPVGLWIEETCQYHKLTRSRYGHKTHSRQHVTVTKTTQSDNETLTHILKLNYKCSFLTIGSATDLPCPSLCFYFFFSFSLPLSFPLSCSCLPPTSITEHIPHSEIKWNY